MPGYRPIKPPQSSGRFSQFHAFLGAIWEMLWNGGFPFVDTDTVKWDRSPTGYAAKVQAPGAAGKAAPAAPNTFKWMAITQLGSSLLPANYDLLICKEWDWSTNAVKVGAPDVYVAKTIEARRTIVNEYYFDNGDNTVQTYSYFTPSVGDPSYGDNFRLATDGGITPNELQVMERRYYSTAILPATAGTPVVAISRMQCLIQVLDTSAPTGVKDPNNIDVTRVEVKPFRTWGRFATQ